MKRSLFEWLTGGSDTGPEYTFDDLESGTAFPMRPSEAAGRPVAHSTPQTYGARSNAPQHSIYNSVPGVVTADEPEGELAVDVYQTPTHIVIKAMIAGVRPDNLDVTIARDNVTIRGKREAATEASGDDFFYQELYWGAFSRTIVLPQEIDTDGAEASEKHGLLNIRLPKLDKTRHMKLKVRSN
jgi:HSP20 family molecular chaperone IbpA